jgi:DNA-binding CsgD family transcriptional regulator
VLAYTSVTDMLSEVDPDTWAGLPEPQRLAIDRVLLRARSDGQATDQRAVAAAFLSVVKGLAAETPVLLAMDDLQWIDASSAQIIGFAARRLSGHVGVLGTVRSDPDCANAASWLQLPTMDAIRRIQLGPLSLGGLREVVAERLGRVVSRRAMVRIHEVSRGNPFYALELARVMDENMSSSEMPLPSTLAELVRTRISGLGRDVHDVLLAASCVATPTVELVARATGYDSEGVVSLLVDAENKGIVEFDGHRVQFTHPLLSKSIYSDATAAQRRSMHRCLAEIVEGPELQARHLAMAVAWGDPRTLQSLDRAADMAHMRGAPAAAAEFLDRAIGLGGDTAERRIRSARHHFEAGDFGHALKLLQETMEQAPPGTLRAEAMNLLAMMNLLNGGFLDAVSLLEPALQEVKDDLVLRVPMLVTLSMALFNVGRRADAAQTIEDAVASATQLEQPHLLSQALGMREMLRMIGGGGVNEENICRALELEDHRAATPVIFRPSTQNVLFQAWLGRLDQAREEMRAVRRRCVERGEESELAFVGVHSLLIELWRGDLSEAVAIAEDATERALQLGGGAPQAFAQMMRAACGAYTGRVDDTRQDVAEALVGSDRSYSFVLAQLPMTILGFLEVSLGNYAAALATLEPLLSRFQMAPEGTEIYVAGFVPDAVEAMVHVGRLDDAEQLVDALESNGRRLHRAWMLATGARGRGMLLAARGDVDGAIVAAQSAMAEHDRLSMPFELARTQLLLGRLQRRLRRREAATSTLREALGAFEALGTPLWADRARAELDRTIAGHGRAGELTVSEQRVADLAASGMTNQDVASALFISPKTVEANLARIYRKLGIHSRAELGRLVAQPEP